MEFLGHKFTTTWKGILANIISVFATSIGVASIGAIILLLVGWNPEEYDIMSIKLTSFISIFGMPIVSFVLLKVYGFFKEGKDYKSLAASYFLLSFLITSFSFSVLYFMGGYNVLNIVVGLNAAFISAVLVYLWLRVFSEKKDLKKTIMLAVVSAVAIVLFANIFDFLASYHVENVVPEIGAWLIAEEFAWYFILSIPLIYGMPKKLGNFQYFFAAIFVLQTVLSNLDIIMELDGMLAILLSVVTLGVIYFVGTNKNLLR